MTLDLELQVQLVVPLPKAFCPRLDLCQLVVPLPKAFAHVLHQLDVLC